MFAPPMILWTFLALIAAGAFWPGPFAYAQSYPAKPVRIVTPTSPGSTPDFVARVVARELSKIWGTQVVVENRPGAGGIIGAEFVAKAAPDGYTLLVTGLNLIISGHLYRNLSIDMLKDFAPVTQMTSAPNLLVVHPSLPVRTVKELIALAKAHPGNINYASGGNGSIQHMAGALFTKVAGINMVHVPYRGSGPAITDLLAGQVSVCFPGPGSVIQHVKSGKLRALAVTSAKRSSQLPDLPTVAEAGFASYDVSSWFGVTGPRDMPRDIVLQLHAAILRTLKNPEVQRPLLAADQDVVWQENPELFGEMLKVEFGKWATAVKESGAQVN